MNETNESQVENINNNGLTKKEKFVKELKSISLIIIAVFAFRSALFEPFKIPSGSMIPTLLIGDFILVNKFSYGFKIPFSDWYTDPIYITGPSDPKAGDVIVFKYPENPSINYIKRVIGVPGDTIEVIEKVVYVNNKPILTEEIDGKEIMSDMDDQYKRKRFKFYKNKRENHEHVSQIDTDNIYQSDFYKITVPKGQYFVMGDNRDYSQDSRSWGFVPFENIKGKAILIWFSVSIPFPWDEAESNGFKFRPWRIGNLIP